MALVLLDHRIDETLIVDDQELARDSYEETIEDASLTPIPEEGPVGDNVETYFETRIRGSSATAALCDQMLAHHNYGHFAGAALVAHCTQQGFPAVLCTQYDELIDEIRPYRRWIPSLQRPTEMDSANFVQGLEDCLFEMNRGFRPWRRPFRTLISVLEVQPEERRVLLEVPAWSPTVIPLRFQNIPTEILDNLSPGFRCRAHVNLGAESLNDIYFCDWQLIP